MTDDRLDLIRSINQQPDDDVLRLAFADYLDEHATTDAERARAELIRVQVQIAGELIDVAPRHHNSLDMILDPQDAEDQRWKHNIWRLRERERHLIDTYSAAWRRPVCVECVGTGWVVDRDGHVTNWTQERCESCDDTGSTGALSGRDPKPPRYGTEWNHYVTWVRGMPVVEVMFREMGGNLAMSLPQQVWAFRYDWLQWAIRAVKEEGATFAVTGQKPHQSGPSGGFLWFEGIVNDSSVPRVVFDKLSGPPIPRSNRPRSQKEYATVDLAHAALNAAVTQLIVEQAYQ